MVLIIIWILALLGDNPMQSEFACHAGLRAKFFCRICWVKGHDAADDEAPLVQTSKTESLGVMVERVKRFMKV